MNTNSIVMWEILLNNADWDCFKTLTSHEILKIQNPLFEEHCAFWKSYICSNKLDVQETNFSFTQFNILRNHLFGRWIEIGRYISALVLWDLIVSVLHGNTYQSNQERRDPHKSPTRKQIHGRVDDLNSVDFVFSNTISSHKEATLYIFEDDEAVIKMIIKGRSPTMRHVSRTHRVALDWLFDRINLDPKIQIKYIDTKNQLTDILTKGNCTRDEWNHLLCLFNISHFSSINSFKAMLKRTQEDAGDERVTAKFKPMTILVSRCRVRDPTVLASTASETPEKTRYASQNVPLSSLNVQQTGTGRPVLGANSSNYSEWNIDDKWSSQVWKSGEMSNTSTGRPENDKFVIDDDIDSDTAAESNLSLKSSSFLNRVNDRLRKMLDLSPEDSMQDIDKRSMIWGTFMSSTLEASVFMGKKYSDTLHIRSKNTGENLTFKQMFEISEQLILELSDEIFGVSQISWESSPWKQLSLVNDEGVISLSHATVYVFSDSVLCLGDESEPNIKYCLGTTAGLVQRFITIQNTGHNRRRTD